MKQTTYSGFDQWVASESVHILVEAGQSPLLSLSTDTAHVSPFVMIGAIAGALVPVP